MDVLLVSADDALLVKCSTAAARGSPFENASHQLWTGIYRCDRSRLVVKGFSGSLRRGSRCEECSLLPLPITPSSVLLTKPSTTTCTEGRLHRCQGADDGLEEFRQID